MRPELTPPFYPAPKGSREEALACHASTVASFFDDARRRAWAVRDVKEAYADLDPALGRRKREAAQRAIRRKAQVRYGLHYLPTAALKASQGPPRVMLGGAQGVGKTRAAEAGLLAAVGMVSLVLVPDHAKAGELVVSLRQQARQRSQVTPAVEWVRGRQAQDEGAPGITMCRVPKAAKALAEQSVSVPATLCVRCPFQDECGYMVQQDRLARLAKEPAGLIVVASRTYWDLPLPGHLSPDLVVLDEAPPNLGYKAVSLSFDTLGEPLTYDGPKRCKGRLAETAEAADALAALLADVRPTLVAIRDAYQETPTTALRLLRERGVDKNRLERVLASLSLYEDRAIEERLGAQIAAFTFTTCDRHPLDLERRLVATIDGHQGKQIHAVRRLIEALQLELGHGRDEPVAVRRSENVGGGRKGLVAHTLGQPQFGPEVPLLHLDGTGDHDIAEALFGPLQLEWHLVERRAVVTQIVGKLFSRQSITGLDANGDPIASRQQEAATLRADLVTLCHTQPDALGVATKRVVEALKAAGLRNATAHFEALRGLNTWESFNAVVVIGREQTTPTAVEGPARALAARAGDLFMSLDGERMPTERRGRSARPRCCKPSTACGHTSRRRPSASPFCARSPWT